MWNSARSPWIVSSTTLPRPSSRPTSTLTEITSALDRKSQDGTITADAVATVMAIVARDVLERIWLIDLERHHITHSQALIRRYHLRTLDALHLAVLLTTRRAMPIVVSADRQLLSAAAQEQVAVLDPTR